MSSPEVFGLKEAFEVFNTHREIIVEVWSFFSAATLAVLGFTVASEKVTHSRQSTWCIQVGYLCFAVGNLYALYTSQVELEYMAAAIARLAQEQKISEFAAVSPTPAWAFAIFYAVVTVAVVIAIELKYRRGGGVHTPVAA